MEVNVVPAPLPLWEAGQGGRIPYPPKSQGVVWWSTYSTTENFV
jgi:hypothetical protein